jgi:hypothetical protein
MRIDLDAIELGRTAAVRIRGGNGESEDDVRAEALRGDAARGDRQLQQRWQRRPLPSACLS